MMPGPDSPLAGIRLLYVVNVDWFLVSHRLPLVRAAIEAGADVTVACADTGSMEPIRALGRVKVVELALSRSGTGPIGELKALWAIASTVRRTRPDVVHSVTIKPVLYGTLATRLLTRDARIINAVSGFGYTVEGSGHRLLSSMVTMAYRVLFRSRRVAMIVQNEGAREWLLRNRCTTSERIHVIEGAGVDCNRFAPPPEPRASNELQVLLASRMLRDKGIDEFAKAAAIVKQTCPRARFILAGSTDVGGNPTSYTDAELGLLCASHPVEWVGHVADMPAFLQTVDVFVLPSYHEGLPKALIEAAASGLPLVASDIDGCRPVISPGVNGELVPPRDERALAAAISALLADPGRRQRFGAESRRIAVERFSIDKILEATLRLYSSARSPKDNR